VARVGAEGVRGADRDDRGLDARRVEAAVDLAAVAVFTLVAGRGHDDDAGFDEATRGAAERVEAVGGDGRRAEAQVDDADVVLRAVGVEPFERLKDAGDCADALRVEHTQVQDV
jgi:hypothetical protein